MALQLPKTFTPTHPTGGLPGYPAVDVFADPGTPVRAPEDGIIDRVSGKDPKLGGRPGGAYGWSIYLSAKSGRYFMTHFGSRTVSGGDRVRFGQIIGTVCDSKVSGKPGTSHIHVGKNAAIRPPKPRKPAPLVDVFVDGKRVNAEQRVDNQKLWDRIRKFAATAREIVIRRKK